MSSVGRYCNHCGIYIEKCAVNQHRCKECSRKRAKWLKAYAIHRKRHGLEPMHVDDPSFEGPFMEHFCTKCGKSLSYSTKDILFCKRCSDPKAPEGVKVYVRKAPRRLHYTLNQVAKMATDAGMSYGRYVSKYGDDL